MIWETNYLSMLKAQACEMSISDRISKIFGKNQSKILFQSWGSSLSFGINVEFEKNIFSR